MLAYECAYKIVCPNPKPHDKKKITDGQKLEFSIVLNMQKRKK